MTEKNKIFNKRALSIKEAVEYACVSRGTVENWLSGGLLPFEELPSRGKGTYCFRRIRKADLDNFLNKYYQQFSISENNDHKEHRELILLPRDS